MRSQKTTILTIMICLILITIQLFKNQREKQIRVMQPMLPPVPLRNQEGPRRWCVPQNSVYFLKIPKCASTTSFQIFVAYGVKHGLTFALPPILRSLRPAYHGSPDGRYNMVVSHTLFDKERAQRVMKESAKYVAAIREPASRFESMWYFGSYEKRFGMTLSAFAKASHYTSTQKSNLNTIATFFGVRDPSDRATESEMYSKAKGLNQIFDLVMIVERFDESLVLLKHLMCWDTEDVAYVKAKIRSPSYRPKVSEAEKHRLRELNRQDVILYKFFSEVFEEKVKAFGKERMQREVKDLRQANARFLEDCGAELTGSSNTVKTWRVTSNSSICKMISLKGADIIKQLIRRQKIWVSSNLTYDLLSWTFT
ncbi:galactosylceramide sulfotransferase-like [Penaeus monodon]|uniref:galactosylceramide sulfotransferase-like n=1 Tax=Penaeus monodon TaxID=6687 RepID=UPI0018A73BCB|nr:galactosylceramide sulfotransferase-like [Penaeus monodon]